MATICDLVEKVAPMTITQEKYLDLLMAAERKDMLIRCLQHDLYGVDNITLLKILGEDTGDA